MDITTLAAWGEFLGGIAVVASLVYLASQVRQSTKVARVTAAQMNAEQWSADAKMLVQDSEVARIYYAGIEDRSLLSESDRQRFDAFLHMNFSSHASRYQLWHEDVVSPETWEQAVRGMRWIASQPGARQWWSVWRVQFADNFCDFIDGLIREAEVAS